MAGVVDGSGLTRRRGALLMRVRERGGATVSELSLELGGSESTVRRELRRLSKSGSLVRTYGGAKAAGFPSAFGAPEVESEEKVRIGRAAAALVNSGETVVLSSGTTTLQVAQHLREHAELSVITNALDIAWLLLDAPGLDLIVLGGAARPGIHSLLGNLTETCAAQVRADTLIMGIPAWDAASGLTSDHSAEIATDRALMEMARRVILVAESSKYGRARPLFLAPLSEVDVLVTDAGLSGAARQAAERLGVQVIIA
jgi:DeoR family transcriptional regulator, aga operon transcriptional repressor